MTGWEIPLPVRLYERVWRSALALESSARLAQSWITTAAVDVLGAYNTSNVGDRAFANVLRTMILEYGGIPHLQDYSRTGHYRETSSLLIGGGGVVSPQQLGLSRVAESQQRPDRTISVVGVSSARNLDGLPHRVKTMLARASFVSVRDSLSKVAMEDALNREVQQQPDIAFCLWDLFPELKSVQPVDGRLGVNVMPVLANVSAGTYRANFTPSPWFSQNLPDVAAVYSEVAPAYVGLVRAAVARWAALGWHVVVVPFASEDHAFAHAVLSDLPVEIPPFIPSSHHVLRRVASCSRFLATRFHAHVFALLCRVPLWSLAYSDKCNRLLADLLDADHAMTPATWVTDRARCFDYLGDDFRTAKLDQVSWTAVRSQALECTRRGVAAALSRGVGDRG